MRTEACALPRRYVYENMILAFVWSTMQRKSVVMARIIRECMRCKCTQCNSFVNNFLFGSIFFLHLIFVCTIFVEHRPVPRDLMTAVERAEN